MTELLHAIIPGTPQPQGSKRVFRTGHVVEDNPKLKPWRADAMIYLKRAAEAYDAATTPITGAVYVEATFCYGRPASHFGTGRNRDRLKASAPTFKHTTPDLDKLARALGDALTQAGILRDDALIVSWSLAKRWADVPYTEVRIHD